MLIIKNLKIEKKTFLVCNYSTFILIVFYFGVIKASIKAFLKVFFRLVYLNVYEALRSFFYENLVVL